MAARRRDHDEPRHLPDLSRLSLGPPTGVPCGGNESEQKLIDDLERRFEHTLSELDEFSRSVNRFTSSDRIEAMEITFHNTDAMIHQIEEIYNAAVLYGRRDIIKSAPTANFKQCIADAKKRLKEFKQRFQGYLDTIEAGREQEELKRRFIAIRDDTSNSAMMRAKADKIVQAIKNETAGRNDANKQMREAELKLLLRDYELFTNSLEKRKERDEKLKAEGRDAPDFDEWNKAVHRLAQDAIDYSQRGVETMDSNEARKFLAGVKNYIDHKELFVPEQMSYAEASQINKALRNVKGYVERLLKTRGEPLAASPFQALYAGLCAAYIPRDDRW